MYCDLHTHTSHSDGSFSPAELVAEAKKLNITIALTDHNTTSGLTEFLTEAEREGVNAVGGTELSTVYEGREFHLIGLFIEPEYYGRIEELCIEYHRLKEESNIALVNKLSSAGCSLDYRVIKQRNVKGNINRAHIAAELVRQGHVGSISEAFDKLLDEKCGYYVPPKRFEILDAIKFLLEIKAVPILAHPLKEIGPDRLRAMLPELIEAGLVAIETMHSSYDEEKIAASKTIAAEFGLLESGGSDFHGSNKPGVSLGVGRGNLAIPISVFDSLWDKRRKLFS